MPLFLNNNEVEQVITMKGTMEALEVLYGEMGQGAAVTAPRSDVHTPTAAAQSAEGPMAHYLKSMSGIFDGVAAILGTRQAVSFEGQAAMELETLATGQTRKRYPYEITRDGDNVILDLRPLVRAIAEERIKGKDPAAIAAAFHRSTSRPLPP